MDLKDFTPEQQRRMQIQPSKDRRERTAETPATPKPSKYRNVTVIIDGQTFASKREGGVYLQLKARELSGEIHDLKLQVKFPLIAPIMNVERSVLGIAVVAHYIADFVYIDRDEKPHILDAKGRRTPLYSLKAKWLNLQEGIVIEEV